MEPCAAGGGGHDRQSNTAGFVSQPRGKIRRSRILALIRTIRHDDMRAHSIGNGVAVGIPQQKPAMESIFQQGSCRRGRLICRKNRKARSERNTRI